MKLKPTSIAVEPDDPFKFDKLGRQQHAETLTQFISSVKEPMTLSVEAGWGHGKTTFLRMWKQQLLDKEFTCISFNAWEADFSEDPLIPFVSEIRKAISEVDGDTGEVKGRIAQISETLRKSGIQIAKRALPVAAKMLAFDLLINSTELIKQAAGEAIEKAIELKFEEYESDKETLIEFKQALSSVVAELEKQGKSTPLVFMIDELDRCRPTFALALLERIKHLFNVEGIVFVLAIDRQQLLESIRTVYGRETDAPRYLRRFVDFEYTLPDQKAENYPAHLMVTHGVQEQLARRTGDANAAHQFHITFVTLSTCFGMRLRDQDHAFSILSVFWRTTLTGEDIRPILLAALLVLKVGRADVYGKFIRNELSAEPLLETIRQNSKGREFLATNYGIELEAYLYAFLESDDANSNKLNEIREIANRVGASPYERKRWEVANYIYDGRWVKQYVRKIVNGLEVSNQFVN